MGLAACGNDDEEEGPKVDTASIVGLWEMENIKGTLTEDGEKATFDVSPKTDWARFYELDVTDYTRFDFKSDKTFIGYEYMNGEWRQYANNTSYVINGNQLTLYKGGKSEKYTIKSFKSDQMVLYFEESGGDYKLSMDVTYKKTN